MATGPWNADRGHAAHPVRRVRRAGSGDTVNAAHTVNAEHYERRGPGHGSAPAAAWHHVARRATAPPGERTALQQRNLDDILGVTRLPERTLESHLRFATFTFRDLVHERLGGRNPFGNRGVRYTGSHDDAALNAGVECFWPDPAARRDLSYDSDLTGRVGIPVLTLHAIGDPTAFVEHEAAYRDTLRGAHRAGNLVQAYTRESEHSALSGSGYAASIAALDSWARTGRRPSPASVAAACERFDARYGTGCFHDPLFRPAADAAKVRPRPGDLVWPAMSAARERVWSRIEGVGIAP